MTNPTNRQTPTAPYHDDIAYLADELLWLQARLDSLPTFRSKEQPRLVAASARRYDRLLRLRIERRLAATREAGLVLGLDRLTTCHNLDGFERLVLLLAAVPVLRPEIESAYRLNGHALGLCPEVAFSIAGLDLRERLARRPTLLPGGRLLKAGLVTTDLPDSATPTDFAWSILSITDRAFQVITGTDADARRGDRAIGRVASVAALFPQVPPSEPV